MERYQVQIEQPIVTVFGSGSAAEGSEEFDRAARLGACLAERGLAICNGGYGGTMRAAAREARHRGVPTVGVTLSGGSWGGANPYIDHEIRCATLAERIMTLLETGDACVVLPGGTGTLAEVGLMLETINKGLLAEKPCVFVGEFWRPLLDLMQGERLLRRSALYPSLPGVEVNGGVATTDDPETAAEFLGRCLC